MKHLLKNLFFLFVCYSSLTVQAQDMKERSLVVADNSWTKEMIPFPVEWAPKLELNGFEELRFAPNWPNPEHQEFWSLVMSWQVSAKGIFTAKEFETHLENYYDGLMKPNHWAQEFMNPKVLFFGSYIEDEKIFYRGKIAFFDGLHSGKEMILNIISEQIYCVDTGKLVIIFRFSPQDYTHSIWAHLLSIKMKDAICTL